MKRTEIWGKKNRPWFCPIESSKTFLPQELHSTLQQHPQCNPPATWLGILEPLACLETMFLFFLRNLKSLSVEQIKNLGAHIHMEKSN